MKKLFILLALSLGISMQIFSQASALANCYSGGTTTITPGTGTVPGLTPSDTFLPCSIRGVPVSDTIYFTNFTSINALGTTFTMTHLKIDSLYLPSGLCWKTNKSNNTFNGGENGVIYVSGTTNAAAGQYKLRIIVDVLLNGFISQTNQNAETAAGLAYRVRVVEPLCTCPYIDNSSADSALIYIPYPACTPSIGVSPTGNDTICPGSSVTLQAETGTGITYKWSNAAHSTTSSITVNTTGSYTVTAYQGADSAVSAPVNVVVGTNPSTTLTLHGPSAICPGATDTITAPAGYSYHWSANAGSATTQSVHVTSAGSYIVTVTNSYGCTAVSSPEVITNSNSCSGPPVAIITPSGHDTICPGGSVTLTATSGTGYTFKWSDAAHSTAQSITVSTGGAYTVTVYSGVDSAVSAATTVVVAAAPSATLTLTGSAAFCSGDSATISAPAGLTYVWSTSATTQSITVRAGGSYTVTVTGAHGCTAVSTPEVITVNTPAADTITRSGLVLTSQPQSSYQWYSGATPISGQTSQSYTATANGTYTVATTDANGCSTVSNSITITGVGINEISGDLSLKIYPNPNSGLFTLQTTALEGNYYEITDELGRVIQKKVILSDRTMVDVSNQNGGVYYLTVKDGQQHGTVRFTVLK